MDRSTGLEGLEIGCDEVGAEGSVGPEGLPRWFLVCARILDQDLSGSANFAVTEDFLDFPYCLPRFGAGKGLWLLVLCL